jgi:hypothetical protein
MNASLINDASPSGLFYDKSDETMNILLFFNLKGVYLNTLDSFSCEKGKGECHE